MLGFINKHRILSSKRLGFQPLIKHTEFMRKVIDIREEGQAFFVDIRKRLDKINHDFLFTKHIIQVSE